MRFVPFLGAIDIVLIAILLAVVSWNFKITIDTQGALDEVASLRAKLEAERTEIDLLKSDWGLLTSPGRLEQLVERYGEQLTLQRIDPSQLTDLDGLPPVELQIDPAATRRTVTGNIDDINTGSVVRESGTE